MTQESKQVRLTFSDGQKLILSVPADELRDIGGVFVSSDGGPFQGVGFEGTEVEGLTRWLERFMDKATYTHGSTVYNPKQVVSVAILAPATSEDYA